jgi:predicted nucleic acid-binding protein
MPEEKDPNIIIDASSLIALYKLNLIEILKDLFTSINAPEAVFTEVGQDLPQWIKILPVDNVDLITKFRENLGEGESEVIVMGIEKENYVLVLDDLRARNTAKKLGLKMTGLLGILIKAKKRGKILKIKPLLEILDEENFRISNKLKNETLKIAGEFLDTQSSG